MQAETSKRKRIERESPAPCSDTWPLPASSVPVDRSNTDSPRTCMAHHFEQLSVDMSNDNHPSTTYNNEHLVSDVEIAESPGPYDTLPSHVPSSSPVSSSLTQRPILNPPRRVVSPPPSTPVASPMIEGDVHMPTSMAIAAAQEKLSSFHHNPPSVPIDTSSSIDSPPEKKRHLNEEPETSLTWQESEITGYKIDMAADDDGTGINGVGFIPTPAIASQRAERRRRQIIECRARETREARQNRYDKRKAASRDSGIGLDEGGNLKRRMVRFEI